MSSQTQNPGAGFGDSAYWVRFSVHNETQSEAWLVAFEWQSFFTDYYFPSENTADYKVIHTGSALPFKSRAIPASGFSFRLPISYKETQTIYMRFESEGHWPSP